MLGKVELTKPEERRELLVALEKGLVDKEARQAKCFWPRHGVRTITGGKMTYYIICFQCSTARMESEGKSKTTAIGHEPQAVFNRLLKAADIPLAPGAAAGELDRSARGELATQTLDLSIHSPTLKEVRNNRPGVRRPT